MAIESVTVGTLVSRVHFHFGNTATAGTALTTEIKYAIGLVMKRMLRTTRNINFNAEGSLSLSSGGGISGTADYALADDVYELIYPSVRHNASPYEPLQDITKQLHDARQMPLWTSSAGRPIYYSRLNRRSTTGTMVLRFYPAPDAAYTLKYMYHALPTVVDGSTADGTEIDYRFPREHVDGLIAGVSLMFPQYLTQDQQITFAEWYRQSMSAMRSGAAGVDGAYYQQQPYTDLMRGAGGDGDILDTVVYSGSPVR